MSVTIVKNGRSDWMICACPGAEPAASFAANELRTYIEKTTGACLHIGGHISGKAFILGLYDELAAFGVSQTEPGYDAYTIKVTDGNVIIAGANNRAVVYGVYDFLEGLGCRFYYPDIDDNDLEVLPVLSEITLEAGVKSCAAQMELRITNPGSFFYKVEPKNLLAQIDWAAKNRYNGMSIQVSHEPGGLEQFLIDMEACGGIDAMKKRGMFIHGPGHSYQHFLKPEVNFAEHPEWFGFLDGKRTDSLFVNFCWSNDEAVDTLINGVVDMVKRFPVFGIVLLVANDGAHVCGCDKCRAAGGSNLSIAMFNKLADVMEKECPGVRLEGVAGYGPMQEIPEDVQPNGKWSAVHAHWGRDHTVAYGDGNYPHKHDLIIWNSLYSGIEICSYYADAIHQPFFGVPYLYALNKDVEFMVEQNIKGSFVMQCPFGLWWNMNFNHFAAPRIAFCADLKADEILRDFTTHYYSPRAGMLIYEYLKLASDNLGRFHRMHWGGGDFYDKAWLGSLGALLRRAGAVIEKGSIYEYRYNKLSAVYEVFYRWAGSAREAEELKDAAKDMTKAEVKKRAGELDKKARELLEYSREVEAKYPGCMDVEWMEGWNINRLVLDPLKELTKK